MTILPISKCIGYIPAEIARGGREVWWIAFTGTRGARPFLAIDKDTTCLVGTPRVWQAGSASSMAWKRVPLLLMANPAPQHVRETRAPEPYRGHLVRYANKGAFRPVDLGCLLFLTARLRQRARELLDRTSLRRRSGPLCAPTTLSLQLNAISLCTHPLFELTRVYAKNHTPPGYNTHVATPFPKTKNAGFPCPRVTIEIIAAERVSITIEKYESLPCTGEDHRSCAPRF